jgi:hypothetical protein
MIRYFEKFFVIFATFWLLMGPAQGAIIATEVGNNEPGTDSANEFVVLLNTGLIAVDLTGYDITDSTLSWDAIGAITLL